MPFYETTIIVRQDASTQQVEKLGEDIKTILENAQGRVIKQENWVFASSPTGSRSTARPTICT